MKTLIILLTVFIGTQSYASNCTEPVRAPQAIEAIAAGLDEALNHLENAYQNSMSLNSYHPPMLCSYQGNGNFQQMKVSVDVEVSTYDDVGESGEYNDICFLWLIKEDGTWSANQIVCEELDIDEEL